MSWTSFYIKLDSMKKFKADEKIKEYTSKGDSVDVAQNKIMNEFKAGVWK